MSPVHTAEGAERVWVAIGLLVSVVLLWERCRVLWNGGEDVSGCRWTERMDAGTSDEKFFSFFIAKFNTTGCSDLELGGTVPYY